MLAEYAYATPEVKAQVVRGVYLALGAALHATAETMRRLSELPSGAVGATVESFEEAVDPRDLARVVNYFAAFASKEFEADPEHLGRFVGRLLAALDTEEIAAACKVAALQAAGPRWPTPSKGGPGARGGGGDGQRRAGGVQRFAWRKPRPHGGQGGAHPGGGDMDQVVLADREVIGPLSRP